MFANLAADTRRLRMIKSKGFPGYLIESLLFENGYQAVVLHRTAHWFKSRRIPFLGPFFHRLSIFLTGVDIAPAAVIGPGLFIGHGVGLVVGDQARIGSRAMLLQQVTIGSPAVDRRNEMPTLGDDVFVAAGARLIGGITIGDGAVIGANAVVAQDVPAGCKVLSAAGLEIRPPRPPGRDGVEPGEEAREETPEEESE